jgi:hypothetical protein
MVPIIHSARDLKSADFMGKSDPYVLIGCDGAKITGGNHLGGKSCKTTVKKQNLNPDWNEAFGMFVEPGADKRLLVLRVFDQDKISDERIAYVTMNLDGSFADATVPLQPKGSLTLSIAYAPLDWLYSYDPYAEEAEDAEGKGDDDGEGMDAGGGVLSDAAIAAYLPPVEEQEAAADAEKARAAEEAARQEEMRAQIEEEAAAAIAAAEAAQAEVEAAAAAAAEAEAAARESADAEALAAAQEAARMQQALLLEAQAAANAAKFNQGFRPPVGFGGNPPVFRAPPKVPKGSQKSTIKRMKKEGSWGTACLQGHVLSPLTVEGSHESCDGCGRRPKRGAMEVMACGECNWYLCNDKCIAKAAKGAAKRAARKSGGKKSKKDKKVRTLENAVFSGECVCACVADV